MSSLKEKYENNLHDVEEHFRKEWNKQGLLNQKKYILEDTYYNLKKTRIFFDNFTRETLSNDNAIFENALEKEVLDYKQIFRIANESIFNPLKNWSAPDKIYPSYVSIIQDDEKYLLKHNIGTLEKITEAGLRGEERLYQATNIIGDRIKILRNIRLRVDNLEVEHDMIIIAPTGIFTIEVKNLKDDHEIDEKGVLRNLKDKRKKSYNVAEQSRRHIHNLKRFFETITSYKFNIYSIIVWANDNSKVINNFEFIPVCYCNTLEYEIFNTERFKPVYSNEEIEYIYKILNDNVLPEKAYPINIDIDNYISIYIRVMYAIKYWSSYIRDGESKLGDEVTVGDLFISILGLFEAIISRLP